MYALDDIPAWAISAAVSKWHRGECGADQNYSWAPAPAVLRKVAEGLLVPVRAAIARISDLVNARPLDELMESHGSNVGAVIKCG
jgi:hypothetical protein